LLRVNRCVIIHNSNVLIISRSTDMTPQEFRQLYLDSQDRLGNNLQSLTTLSTEFDIVINQLTQDYESINAAIEAFLNRLENQSGDSSS
jgi:hypothetical protein